MRNLIHAFTKHIPTTIPLDAQATNYHKPYAIYHTYNHIKPPAVPQALLHALGLPSLTHLTRGEWRVLRRSLGRPRRLSLSFLKQARANLGAWRQRCRAAYSGGLVLPADVPQQLRVGQRVTARHPVTRQLHEGRVLTVEGACYR